MSAFYVVAGTNHFIHPAGYYKLIPPFFSHPYLINFASGVAEILFGILILIPRTRETACYGIILMLIAFLPVHIFMIHTGWCVQSFYLPAVAIWIRLIILQPLLILWAWKNRK